MADANVASLGTDDLGVTSFFLYSALIGRVVKKLVMELIRLLNRAPYAEVANKIEPGA